MEVQNLELPQENGANGGMSIRPAMFGFFNWSDIKLSWSSIN
jgi:hypothetical protein